MRRVADLEPLKRQAQHNGHAGWSWCFAHPDQVDTLFTELEDLSNRLMQISVLVGQAKRALADHHLYPDQTPCVKVCLEEMGALSELPEETEG